MSEFTKEELEKALPPITSLISKCEKAQLKLREGTSQYSLIKNRIAALKVAEVLLMEELVKKK